MFKVPLPSPPPPSSPLLKPPLQPRPRLNEGWQGGGVVAATADTGGCKEDCDCTEEDEVAAEAGKEDEAEGEGA